VHVRPEACNVPSPEFPRAQGEDEAPCREQARAFEVAR